LACPHRIGKIDVNVKKGDRDVPRRRLSTPGPTPKTHNNNDPGVISRKSNLKQVTMSMSMPFFLDSSTLSIFYSDEQISSLSLPAKKYRIHISNLLANIAVETLSEEFDWDIYDIVMDPSVGNRASSTQCWLKNPSHEREVDDFVQRWNEKAFKGSIIQCVKEEDELELCNKFQFGRCSKSSDECHWEHVPCTADGTCSLTCPYGHELGMKPERNSPNSKSNFLLIKYSNRIL
jgi:hypothetical protein